VTAEALPLRLTREIPHLAALLGDVASVASLARLAEIGRAHV